jgi:hypothetical protein
MEVEDTAVVEEVSTEAGAEVSTAAVGAGFMEAEAVFTAVEVLVEEAEATLLSVDARLAVFGEAASMVAVAILDAVAGALAGAVEVGAAVGADEAGVGAGDLAMAGRIGDGDIHMATTATARITLILTIPTRPTALRKTT